MQGMIGHHEQALEMTEAVPARTSRADMEMLGQADRDFPGRRNPDDARLAEGAVARRFPTLMRITRRREADAWHADGETRCSSLADMKDPEFDRLFLEFMIKHHEGALVMVEELFRRRCRSAVGYVCIRVGRRCGSTHGDRAHERYAQGGPEMRAAAVVGFLSLAGIVLSPGFREAPSRGFGLPDPRIGLRAGFRDAGTAARNMELVASLPKPEGFFDPKAPAGLPTPAGTDP